MWPTRAPIAQQVTQWGFVRWAPYPAGAAGWVLARGDPRRWRIRSTWIGRCVTGIIEAERGRLVLWLPVFMGAGVVAYYALRMEPPAWIGAKFAIAGFGAAMVLANWPVLRAIGLMIGFATIGFASAQ